MSDFDVGRWRPAPFLPEADSRDGSLTFVVATLCFLACLTLLAVLATNRASREWTSQLDGQATIIVRPKANETPDGAAARAAETLAGVPGVAEARALEKEKAEALIAPRLVAVQLTKDSPADAIALDRALKAQGLDAVVDDHSVWMADIQHAAQVARWIGLTVFGLIATAAAAVVAFATRAGLAALAELDPGLPRYVAVAAYLHERDGDRARAARLYAEAAGKAPTLPEREHLTRQAARLNAG